MNIVHRRVQGIENYINIGDMSEYNIIIERDNASGLYCGQCEQIPEAISQGSTEEELLDNIREAIELVLADRQESIHRQYAGRNYIRRRIAVGV